MALNFKTLVATLGIITVTAATMAASALAQQDLPATEHGPLPNAQPPSGVISNAPAPKATPTLHGHLARSALVTANVNLRRGPGTDSEILTTIPGGSPVRITNCSGEWCAVMWNGRRGYAIARNLYTGGPRPARQYRVPPGYAAEVDDEPGPPVVYGPPAYYPPPVILGPGYYTPGYYYGPGWGWRRTW